MTIEARRGKRARESERAPSVPISAIHPPLDPTVDCARDRRTGPFSSEGKRRDPGNDPAFLSFPSGAVFKESFFFQQNGESLC